MSDEAKRLLDQLLKARDSYRYAPPKFYMPAHELRAACKYDGLDYDVTKADLESRNWIVYEISDIDIY